MKSGGRYVKNSLNTNFVLDFKILYTFLTGGTLMENKGEIRIQHQLGAEELILIADMLLRGEREKTYLALREYYGIFEDYEWLIMKMSRTCIIQELEDSTVKWKLFEKIRLDDKGIKFRFNERAEIFKKILIETCLTVVNQGDPHE